MLTPQAVAAPGTWISYVGALPLIPLAGFVINGLLSLVPAYHAGPSDPSAEEHGHHGGHHGGGPASGHHGEAPGGDEHHVGSHAAPPRHRFAGVVSVIGPLVLVISFALAVLMWIDLRAAGTSAPFVERAFTWMMTGDLRIDWAFQLDQLSMVMVLVITGVGALIHIFSVGYMRADPGYPRYFAYLNLFVAFMLVLVLGASYPVMFVGWEGVGLCSYLLIGYWYDVKANADAGKKAFIMNRIGDFGFMIAMFMIFANLGALDFAGVQTASSALKPGGTLVTTICLFLFLGCTGKSAQIPLYTWLPDAMAGPTPVSALIHAATMVTAGVYLVARSSFLFSIAPVASLTVVIVGAVTAFFAATIGLKQWDIKKVLAYSTVSQLGYMFVAVGVGAYVAGMFHLVTHAFFKALLFLGSGSVIHAMHAAYHATGRDDDAQDMRNMGGLRRYLRWTWILMWIATLAICGIPLFSGFFSKDQILGAAFAGADHGTLADAIWLGIPGRTVLYIVYGLAVATAFLTAIYMTRMMLYTFHGPNRTGEAERAHLHEAPFTMTGPLVILGVLAAAGGWLNLPESLRMLGPVGILEHWLEPIVGTSTIRLFGEHGVEVADKEVMLVGIAILVAVGGIVLAIVRLKPARLVPPEESPPEKGIERVLADKYYVDELYDTAIVTPIVDGSRNVLAKGIDEGLLDGAMVNGSAWLAKLLGSIGSRFQSGQVGTYAWAIALGVLLILGAFTRY